METWEGVMEARLRSVARISEEQSGFMPGRSTTDAALALWILMAKCREGQKEMQCVCIDLDKAYDRCREMSCGIA